MKIRKGFVSNSSSSSFVISLNNITATQLKMIEDHYKISELLDDGDRWTINSNGSVVTGYTWMDNFDMCSFLADVVGVSDEFISWGE